MRHTHTNVQLTDLRGFRGFRGALCESSMRAIFLFCPRLAWDFGE